MDRQHMKGKSRHLLTSVEGETETQAGEDDTDEHRLEHDAALSLADPLV